MRMSRRAQRMERHYKRSKRNPGFNLISLMDIFTILVFFLLVNSSEVEVLPSTKAIKLPESIADTKPRQTLVVMVTKTDILLQGHAVAPVFAVLRDQRPTIPDLGQALVRLAAQEKTPTGSQTAKVKEVTIMGDKTIPFKLLKKVMVTCTQAGYNTISLSVLQKGTQP